jgi:hypothetical protein
MKFNINQLTDAILDYMDKNEIKNPMEFPTLAFYKSIQESGLSDILSLRLAAETDGKFRIVQLKDRQISNYLEISIKDPTVLDPADDPKNKPINPYADKNDIDIVSLNSNDETSLNKRIVIKRENRTQGSLDSVLTNEMKEKKLNIYKVLAKYDTLSEIADNITDYETMIHFDDRKLYHLSQAIYSYKQYQESLLKTANKSDEIVIPSVLNKHVENVLNSLISLSEKREQQSTKPHNNVDQLADIIKGDVSFSVPSLLSGADTFKMTGINQHVKLNNESISGVSLGNSFLNTIKENVDNGTLSNIMDDLYKKHISQDFKDEYSLKLRMTTRQKTIEDRLDNADVNNFVESLKVKYPYVFKDNELFSYQVGVLDTKDDLRNISDFFNTFQLNDDKTKDCLLAKMTDSFLIDYQDLYYITDDEPCIRFVGQTDASIKSFITAELNYPNDNNEDMKVLRVYSLMLLDQENNQFNQMALNDLFSYCAKNKYALNISNLNVASDDSITVVLPELRKLAEQYKDSVIFIDSVADPDIYTKIEKCTTDMPTFIKQYNTTQVGDYKLNGSKNKLT